MKITDAAVKAFRQSFENTDNNCETYQDVRKALTAALPHLHLVDVAAVREECADIAKSWGDTARNLGQHVEASIANDIKLSIRALSAEPAQVDQWRDMKDAPRTGEEIIYLTKYGEIGFCKYTLAMSDDEDDLWWDFQSDADVYPKYWLPRTYLPAAPTEVAGR